MKRTLSILLAALLLAGVGVVGAFAADFQIIFDANTTDPTVANMPGPEDKTIGTPLALPGNIPTRDNYIFKGWARTPTGPWAFDHGDPFNDDTDPTDQTLYAIWVRQYQVTYNANTTDTSVHGLPAAQTKTVGEALTLVGAPTRTDYVFKGWTLTSTGAKAYDPGDSYTDDSIVTGRILYALWEATFYTVTFNGNTPAGGTVTNPVAPQTQDNGLDMTLTNDIPSCAGYDFMGWSKNPAGPVHFSQGGNYTDRVSVTLYAIWEANEYTVAFNGNAPSGSTAAGVPAALTKTRGVTLPIPTAEPTCAGYAFKGWAISAADAATGTVKYSPGGNNTTDEAVTLFAIWAANTYTVRYNANGGSGTMADSTHTYGTAKLLTANAYTNANATFAGWATAAADAVTYNNSHNVINLTAVNGAVVELYAKWNVPSKDKLNARIAEVEKLEERKYTAVSWAGLQEKLDAARAVAANANATQKQIDDAKYELDLYVQKQLVARSFIFNTKYEATIWNWLLFFIGFGFIWMWF